MAANHRHVIGVLRRIGLSSYKKTDEGYVVQSVRQGYVAVTWQPKEEKHLWRMAFIRKALELDGCECYDIPAGDRVAVIVRKTPIGEEDGGNKHAGCSMWGR